MTRSRRDLSSAPFFHIINRAIDAHDLFVIDRDFVLFEHKLAAHVADSGARIHAYALMSNHFHLLVEPSGERDLSQAIGDAQSRYTKAFNRRTGRRGTLFDRRFLAFGVDSDDEFLRVSQYIHANPIAITGERPLPAYRWSSLPIYLGRRRDPEWLSTEVLAAMIRVETYLSSIVGGEPGHEISVRVRHTTTTPPTLHEVHSGVTDLVRDSELDHRWIRRLTCFLVAELRAGDVVDVADWFGCSTGSIRRDIAMCRNEIASDDSFAHFVDRLVPAVAATGSRRAL